MWLHHCGITFAIFAFMMAGEFSSRARLALLAVSCVLIRQLVILNQSAKTPPNFIQSPVLFGSLMLLILLHTAAPSCLLPGPALAGDRLDQPGAGTV